MWFNSLWDSFFIINTRCTPSISISRFTVLRSWQVILATFHEIFAYFLISLRSHKFEISCDWKNMLIMIDKILTSINDQTSLILVSQFQLSILFKFDPHISVRSTKISVTPTELRAGKTRGKCEEIFCLRLQIESNGHSITPFPPLGIKILSCLTMKEMWCTPNPRGCWRTKEKSRKNPIIRAVSINYIIIILVNSTSGCAHLQCNTMLPSKMKLNSTESDNGPNVNSDSCTVI